MSQHDDKLFDSRLIERNLRKGLISRRDLDKHIKSLPDLADAVDRWVPELPTSSGRLRVRPARPATGPRPEPEDEL